MPGGPTPPVIVRGRTFANLLASWRAVCVVPGLVDDAQAQISLWPEPQPTSGTPLVFVTPGDFLAAEGQNLGAGRHLPGFAGEVVTSVAVRTVLDMGGQGLQRLTGPYGISPIINAVVNNLEYKFIMDDNGNHLTEQPVWLRLQARPEPYQNAPQWTVARLHHQVLFAPELTLAEGVVLNPLREVYSNLAGPLLAIRDVLRANGVLTDQGAMVGTYEQVFPLPGSPSCAIVPGDLTAIASQGAGGGRFLPGQTTTFTVGLLTRNILDAGPFDRSLLTSDDSSLGLLSQAHRVIDQLHQSLIVDARGSLVTEEPIRLVKVGTPVRMSLNKGVRAFGVVPLVFQARFAYNVDRNVL